MDGDENNYRGAWIVFEGPDGTGKSTQFRKAFKYLSDCGLDVSEFREPGGTNIGEKIRDILLDVENKDISPLTELFLFQASRAQLMEQKILPHLKNGGVAFSDRCFYSSLAYQSYGGGLPVGYVDMTNRIALGGVLPDLALFYDVDADVAASRMSPLMDRIERKGREHHERVRQGYLDIAKQDPDRIKLIDASRDLESVFEESKRHIDELIRSKGLKGF